MITPAAIEPEDARSAGQRNSKHSALLSKQMGWMDGMRFYVLFNSVLVI